MVGILARDRHGAIEALCGERGDGAACGAVIGGDNGIDLVVVGGQELLHVGLGVLGQPAIGIGLADIDDIAGIDRGLENFHGAGEQEVGVGIGARTLDEDVIAGRRDRLHFARLDAAHFGVVEGEVERIGIFDQPVIANHRNAFGDGRGNGGLDGVVILRQNDQSIGALGDEAFDIGELLGRRGLRVGRNIGGAELFELGLDGGFVGLPAFFLEVGPRNADGETVLRERAPCHTEKNSRAQKGRCKIFHDFPPAGI